MKDEDRKILTEFLGECWHEWRSGAFPFPVCRKCGEPKKHISHRTFNNWNDFGALIEKIRKHPKAEIFLQWLHNQGYAIWEFGATGYLSTGAVDKDLFPLLVLKAIKEWVL